MVGGQVVCRSRSVRLDGGAGPVGLAVLCGGCGAWVCFSLLCTVLSPFLFPLENLNCSISKAERRIC